VKKKPKILVIVGPTASGKTSISIELAKRFSGEVVSADSRQVYRGLDLGTGKVTKEEMQGVPHHLLDVADPKETYTVADYVRDGRVAIADILKRNKLPIIVGGTFFYIDALLGKLTLPDIPSNPFLRKGLEEMNAHSLYALLKAKDPNYAKIVDKDNPRRLIRALEIIEALGYMPAINGNPLYDSLTLGINLPKEQLNENIRKRLDMRTEAGMIEEVEHLHKQGLSYERMESLGLEYRYIARYLQGKIDRETLLKEIEFKSRQFARRQMTWLKGDAAIVWVNPKETQKICRIIRKFL
jgi:tRNA dimethylallyltransferase